MFLGRYVLFLVFLASVSICSADPNPATRYLMNEPVSLLDFGLYKLENYFAAIGPNDSYVFSIVRYDWELNRINVYIYNTNGNNEISTKKEAKKWSKNIICRARELLGIDCSSLKSVLGSKKSIIYNYFSHTGFQKSGEPSNLAAELDEIVVLKVQTHWGISRSNPVHCEVPIFGEKILCTK